MHPRGHPPEAPGGGHEPLPPGADRCDTPDENQDYVHRIGRTGRAKRQGVAVSLIADYPSKLRIDDIAAKTRNEIVPVRFNAEGHLEVIQ